MCRFCRVAVEDEIHVLFGCESAPQLLLRRAEFLRQLFEVCPEMYRPYRAAPATTSVELLVEEGGVHL